MEFNVTAELQIDPDEADDVVDHLKDFAAAASPTPDGEHLEVTITIPANDVRQATMVALGLLTDWPLRTLQVLPTELWDALHEVTAVTAVTESLSVTQVATELGISRQAVLQRLDAGTLPGAKVGGTWTIPADAVAAALRRQSRNERSRGRGAPSSMQQARGAVTTNC